MSYNIYTADKIEIGGEIYFDDAYSRKFLTQSNYDEYWFVNVKDVRVYNPPVKQEKPQQI